MPWARLDEGYFTNRKVVDLSAHAKLLDLAAIAYSARELTDGLLSIRDLRIVAVEADVDDWQALADELLACGRWERGPGKRYVIHDYLRYNPSREQILLERERGAERQARFRAKEARARKHAQKRNGVTNASSASGPGPEPVSVSGSPVPSPVPNSELDDARAPREGSEFKTNGAIHRPKREPKVSTVMHPPDANGHVRFERLAFNEDLAVRIQAIGEQLGDDNVMSSITHAQRLQAATHLSDGDLANAIKEAHRGTIGRMNDLSRAPPSKPMAYFLGTLDDKAQHRAKARAG